MEKKSLNLKRIMSAEVFITIILFVVVFGIPGHIMGTTNFINTLFNTAYDLLIKTVLYLMAIIVVVGGISEVMSEFGIVAFVNKLLFPVMKPLFDMPGVAALGILTTYLSDNPAILTLSSDSKFKRFFKKYQLAALVNLGTGFGMGLIVSVFMISTSRYADENFISATLIGNVGAIIGTIISTRLMLKYTKNKYGNETEIFDDEECPYDIFEYREIREGSVFERFLSAVLTGGANGVKVSVEIIPGVLIISSFVMLLSYGKSEAGVYTGAAYEGIALIPWIGEKLSFILTPLFGFTNEGNIAVPLTAIGSSGAAIGLIPNLVKNGFVKSNDIAVFTAMCMTLSGYLSTHVAMMNSLGFEKDTARAIFSHTIGAIFAGISANIIYKILMLF